MASVLGRLKQLGAETAGAPPLCVSLSFLSLESQILFPPGIGVARLLKRVTAGSQSRHPKSFAEAASPFYELASESLHVTLALLMSYESHTGLARIRKGIDSTS